MPADALATIQHLSRQLGRQPTLEELLTYAGQPPAGMPVDPPHPVPPSLREDEHGDGPYTAQLRALELMARNPELLQVREQLVNLLLFGPLAQDSGPAIDRPRQSHAPGPKTPLGPGRLDRIRPTPSL